MTQSANGNDRPCIDLLFSIVVFVILQQIVTALTGCEDFP